VRLLARLLISCVVLLACVLVGLVVLHKDSSIRTEIWIDNAPPQVWQILTATAEYPSWNPMISRLTGELREGNVIEFTEGSGSGSMTFHPRVLSVRPAQELRWKGYVLAPGLFDGEHRFVLERSGRGTQLIQSEEFSGLLAGSLTQGVLRETVEQMEAMNLALKQRSEAFSSRGGKGLARNSQQSNGSIGAVSRTPTSHILAARLGGPDGRQMRRKPRSSRLLPSLKWVQVEPARRTGWDDDG